MENSIYGNAPSSLNCGQEVVDPSQELELEVEEADFLESKTVDVIEKIDVFLISCIELCRIRQKPKERIKVCN
jgi:hypothetical protein